MPRRSKPLTAKQVANAKPGKHTDGGGLMLYVLGDGGSSWVLRYTLDGRRREIGLGPAKGHAAVGLADARAEADRLRLLIRAGRDPATERAQVQEVRRTAAERALRHVARACLDGRKDQWRNDKHRAQWWASLERHVLPRLGDTPVERITTDLVADTLRPLWTEAPETARRVRQRLEAVLAHAAVQGLRPRNEINPASWANNLQHLLPPAARMKQRKRERTGRSRHHPALPYPEVPAFLAALGKVHAIGAAALRFAVLTAARSGEVRGMTWAEVDLARRRWVIPAERMKSGLLHTVPLSAEALAVLEEMRPLALAADGTMLPGARVFPGRKPGRPLSDMTLSLLVRRLATRGVPVGAPPRWRDTAGNVVVPHGFRSSFKEWCRSRGYPDELSELALAHVDTSETRAAYARDELVMERRPVMEAWASWCRDGGVTQGEEEGVAVAA